MKTITDYANDYVGHPQEIDEDLSVYQKREAYMQGMEKAFELIRHEINVATINQYKFKILHLYDFMDKVLGRKVEPLRPLSSLSEAELEELGKLVGAASYCMLKADYEPLRKLLEHVYSKHIDIFGLIGKGLALESSKGMYGKEEEK